MSNPACAMICFKKKHNIDFSWYSAYENVPWIWKLPVLLMRDFWILIQGFFMKIADHKLTIINDLLP